MVEYGLMLALIAIVAMAGAALIGNRPARCSVRLPARCDWTIEYRGSGVSMVARGYERPAAR